MYKMLLASNNKYKEREFLQLINKNNYPITLLTTHLGKDIGSIPETGSSYLDNALIKAHIVYQYYRLPVLADDSGMELTEFSNLPGIYSNRYAGPNANDKDNCNKLRKFLLKNKLTFTPAKYSCVLVYQSQVNKYQKFEATWKGKICDLDLSSDEGFGYDPMFIPTGCNETLAKLDSSYKSTYSHRARAVKKLIKYIEKSH
ncbi:MAG: non-canonical purine NTP pyrophosphatase [Candidatus Dasytiphilus stammeri]